MSDARDALAAAQIATVRIPDAGDGHPAIRVRTNEEAVDHLLSPDVWPLVLAAAEEAGLVERETDESRYIRTGDWFRRFVTPWEATDAG